MRAWSSGQTWGGSFQHELDLLMSGLKETENPGVPCEQSSRLGEPLQPRDLRQTRLSGKFTARFSSEAAGFPAPQSRRIQARRHKHGLPHIDRGFLATNIVPVPFPPGFYTIPIKQGLEIQMPTVARQGNAEGWGLWQ